MRIAWFYLLGVLLAAACSSTRPRLGESDNGSGGMSRSNAGPSEAENPQVIPIDEPNGKVVASNTVSRFVVIDFYLSPLPRIGERMNVYRDGFKVGEVKITGPEQFSNIAADLTAGEARTGDEIRSK